MGCVMIGCEESGVVRRAFIGREHDAISVDLMPARDGSINHCVTDIMELLTIIDKAKTGVKDIDLIILHPPCQYIAVSGNRWHAGTQARKDATDWTIKLWELAKKVSSRVVLENPVGLKMPGVKPQWIQPWEFGHPEMKKTGLWLHGLPPLEPTNIVQPTEERVWRMSPSPTRTRDRATTYLGIADALADQYGKLLGEQE